MTVLCAWCGKVLKSGSDPVSHGICDDCSWSVERKLLSDMQRVQVAPRRRRPAVAASIPLPGFGEKLAV